MIARAARRWGRTTRRTVPGSVRTAPTRSGGRVPHAARANGAWHGMRVQGVCEAVLFAGWYAGAVLLVPAIASIPLLAFVEPPKAD